MKILNSIKNTAKIVLFALIFSAIGFSTASANSAIITACEEVTLSDAPIDSTATFTPSGGGDPITVAGNGTFSIPAGTYNIVWSNGWRASSTVVPTCSAGPIPPTPLLTAIGSCTASVPKNTLSWVASPDATSYHIRRCTSGTCLPFTEIATTSNTTYEDTAVVTGTTYKYSIGAYSATGIFGLFSNVVVVTPICTPPPPPPPPPQPPAILMVIKQVINDDGGTAIASDFNLHVKLAGADVVGSPNVGVVAPGRSYTLDAGIYVVSEDANILYTSTFSGNCDASGSVLLTPGSFKVCTITNNDVAVVPPPPPPPPVVNGTLIVIKQVINDNGGTKSASDFNLHVKSSTGVDVAGSPAVGLVAPGRSYTLPSGMLMYMVTEDIDPNYTSTFIGDCDASGSVWLSTGSTKTCTIINNDVAIVAPPPPAPHESEVTGTLTSTVVSTPTSHSSEVTGTLGGTSTTTTSHGSEVTGTFGNGTTGSNSSGGTGSISGTVISAPSSGGGGNSGGSGSSIGGGGGNSGGSILGAQTSLGATSTLVPEVLGASVGFPDTGYPPLEENKLGNIILLSAFLFFTSILFFTVQKKREI